MYMKIIQFETLNDKNSQGLNRHTIFGLGDDGEMYTYSIKDKKWVPIGEGVISVTEFPLPTQIDESMNSTGTIAGTPKKT